MKATITQIEYTCSAFPTQYGGNQWIGSLSAEQVVSYKS